MQNVLPTVAEGVSHVQRGISQNLFDVRCGDFDRRSPPAIPIWTRRGICSLSGSWFTDPLAIVDVELDLHDVKAKLHGQIKTRLSLASNGSLIASNAQQLALELVRSASTAAGGYIDGVFSISLQTPPAVIDQPIKDVLDKLNLFMRIAGEAAKVDFNKQTLVGRN